MTRIGAIFSPYPNPPEVFRAAVAAAEDAGLAELWLWEDCFRESAFASAAAALAWTQRLRIGIGIAPMPLRNAAVTAMEIATIERMFPGRLLPGVGHGVLAWMGQVGARVASPLTLMREYVPALRGLLAGDAVSESGRYVTLDGVRLDWPPAVAPRVYAAAEGPRTLHLSGQVADGTILTAGYPPARIAEAVSRVRAGRADAGRPGPHDIVGYVITGFGDEGAARARADLARWSAPDEPERVLTGSEEEVAAGAARFAAAGLDAVILQPTTSEPDLAGFYAATARVAAML